MTKAEFIDLLTEIKEEYAGEDSVDEIIKSLTFSEDYDHILISYEIEVE